MDLQQYKTEDGIELYIDTETGMSFSSQSGYSRMSGVPRTTLHRRLTTCPKITPDQAKTLATRESDSDPHSVIQTTVINSVGAEISINLLSENWIVENLQKDNPALLAKMSKLGVRATLHKMAGYEVKSITPEQQELTPTTYEDAVIALADQIKAHRKEVKQLESQLGNAKQSVKDNLEKFEEYFDENMSFEENVEKFGKIIIQYKEEIMNLTFQKERLEYLTKSNVNYFMYNKRHEKRLDEGERRAFGKLMKKICLKNDFDYEERTEKKDGYDLNNNHYPDCVLERIYDLVCKGYQYAQIVEIYTDVE